ncbi:hypothetical protein [Streptomyces collinus]|uniref:hypothetical protein n=1 Tax=Streptomyces collinus TaxID=42684 RepID=UPI0034120FD1
MGARRSFADWWRGPRWRRRREGFQRWRSGVNWKGWGSGLAAGIGIATLLFTGCSTYFQAEVAKDQLDQSREKAKRDEQDQASRVAFWMDMDNSPSSPHPIKIHILNRSPDPVAGVLLVVSAYLRIGVNAPAHSLIFGSPTIGPCAELVFKAAEFQVTDALKGGLDKWKGKRLNDLPAWFPTSLAFIDRNGKKWVRDKNGLSRLWNQLEFPPEGFIGAKEPPQVIKAATCESTEQ